MKNYSKVNLIYFSATGTTQIIVSTISKALDRFPQQQYNLNTLQVDSDISISSDELAIFAVPVYSGRVPEIAKQYILKFKGNHTSAILIGVYGNRAFEDALVELQDITQANGFITISAAAFIAQHSIFPQVASGRPNKQDLEMVADFAIKSINHDKSDSHQLVIKGNRPYRAIKPVPLVPKTSRTCNKCGLCAKQCPVKAISIDNPKKIDKTLCISCAHCISICPQKARRFGGLLYWLATKKFTKAFSSPQMPYMVYR